MGPERGGTRKGWNQRGVGPERGGTREGWKVKGTCVHEVDGLNSHTPLVLV